MKWQLKLLSLQTMKPTDTINNETKLTSIPGITLLHQAMNTQLYYNNY